MSNEGPGGHVVKLNVIHFMKYDKQWGKNIFKKMHVTVKKYKGTFWQIFKDYFMLLAKS